MKTGKTIIILILCIIVNFGILSQENIPRIGFLPFSASYAAGTEPASRMQIALARYMTEQQIFAPYSVINWLERDFKAEKAANMEKLLSAARAINLPVDYLCHGSLFKCGQEYGLIISLYPLALGNYYSCYFRTFIPGSTFFSDNAKNKQFENHLISITAEMQARHKRQDSTENRFNYKAVYLDRFVLHLLDKPDQDGNTAELQSLKINNVEYKKTDNFFNQLLLYNFHTSRFFSLRNDNLDDYVADEPDIPANVDYIVAAELFAAADSSLLKITVTNNKEKRLLLQYEYPFAGLSLINLNNALKENKLIIASYILDPEELSHTGITSIAAGIQPVFYEGYYLGEGNQENLLLTFGYNHFIIGNNKMDIFVKPFPYSSYLGK